MCEIMVKHIQDVCVDLRCFKLRERGWPKSKGILREKVISEGVITASMQDAVRIGLALGSGMPEAATSIVISQIQNPSQQQVSDNISRVADLGSNKVISQPIRKPQWLQFCLTEFEDNPGEARLIFWSGTDEDTWSMSDPNVDKMILTAKRNALIAMSWAIRNPNDCVQLFQPNEESTSMLAIEAQHDYEGWLVMGNTMVTLYESVVGLRKFEDLREI